MAVPTGSGTEVLSAHHFDGMDALQPLIIGVKFHTYTVLSTIVFSVSIGAAGDTYLLVITGHDNHAGADSNASIMIIAKVVAVAGQTFVFNDKFSMNGFGSAAYTEPLNTAAEMATVAQQGGTLNRYQYIPLDADVDCDIHVTFIDQNNA